MHRRPLGQSGLEVPAIGMGTWRTFDVRGARDEGRARALVDLALALGVDFFDSSPMYGEAERVLGDRQPSAPTIFVTMRQLAVRHGSGLRSAPMSRA